jgi:hypothetical protein
MRRTVIPVFVLVLASVVLGATVFREQVARAAASMPQVFVANDTSHPVPVREQGTVSVTSSDDPGRSAFAFFQSDSWESGEDSHHVDFTVPAGKRLVIDAVSISSSLDTHGQKMLTAAVQAHVNGQFEDYFMTPTFTGVNTSGRDVYIAGQQTTIYADGGTDVLLFGSRDSFTGAGILNVSVQGHLIDCTVAACN